MRETVERMRQAVHRLDELLIERDRLLAPFAAKIMEAEREIEQLMQIAGGPGRAPQGEHLAKASSVGKAPNKRTSVGPVAESILRDLAEHPGSRYAGIMERVYKDSGPKVRDRVRTLVNMLKGRELVRLRHRSKNEWELTEAGERLLADTRSPARANGYAHETATH